MVICEYCGEGRARDSKIAYRGVGGRFRRAKVYLWGGVRYKVITVGNDSNQPHLKGNTMNHAEPQFTFDQLMGALRRMIGEYGVAEQQIKGYCREICSTDADNAAHLIGWLEMEVMRRNDIHKDLRKVSAAINVINRAVDKWGN